MKPFHEWTQEIAKQSNAASQAVDPDFLPEGMNYMGNGEYKATCSACREFKGVDWWQPGEPFDIRTFCCDTCSGCP